MLVISPDPISFGYLHLSPGPERDLARRIAHLERRQMLLPLHRSGIAFLNWDVAQPLDQAITALRRGAQRGPGGPA
jgi:hypothetical protein